MCFGSKNMNLINSRFRFDRACKKQEHKWARDFMIQEK